MIVQSRAALRLCDGLAAATWIPARLGWTARTDLEIHLDPEVGSRSSRMDEIGVEGMVSLADQAHAAQIIGRVQYLLAADSLWMSGVGRGQPEQIEALGMVKNELMTTLAALRSDVPFIRGLASELDEGAGERALSHPQVPDDVKTSFRRVTERRGGFVKFVTEQLESLDAVLAEKGASIVSDYDRMRAGDPRTIRGGSDPIGLVTGTILIVVGSQTDSPTIQTVGTVLVILSV